MYYSPDAMERRIPEYDPAIPVNGIPLVSSTDCEYGSPIGVMERRLREDDSVDSFINVSEDEDPYKDIDIDLYFINQERITKWIDKTNQYQPKNPFTPRTPNFTPSEIHQEYLQPQKPTNVLPHSQIVEWVDETNQSHLANPFTPRTPDQAPSEIHQTYLQLQNPTNFLPYTPIIGWADENQLANPFTPRISYQKQLEIHQAYPPHPYQPMPIYEYHGKSRALDSRSFDHNKLDFRGLMTQFTNLLKPRGISEKPAISNFAVEEDVNYKEDAVVREKKVTGQTQASGSDRFIVDNGYGPAQGQASTVTKYSLAYSRTESTEYGVYYRRMALSQETPDTLIERKL